VGPEALNPVLGSWQYHIIEGHLPPTKHVCGTLQPKRMAVFFN